MSNHNNSKEDTIRVSGRAIEALPGAKFRITLENGATILGYVSGRMRKNDIKILVGDSVEVELSLYDLSKGRIVRRG